MPFTKQKFFTILSIIVVLILLSFAAFLLQLKGNSGPVPVLPSEKSYKDISYTLGNQTVALVNGYSEIEAAPGSASKIITKYFGNEATGDLNGDGMQDTAFLLTQETGGSGTFYYVVVALKTSEGYQSTNTILLGDRIAPQSTQINTQGEILVNYVDRKPSEPMTAVPTVGISKYFKIENGTLVEQMDLANFGDSIDLVVNQQVKLSDTLIVTLKEINDSRCPQKPGLVCLWIGELSGLLSIVGGNVGTIAQEVKLGSQTAKKVTKNGYTFELKNVTETTASVIITKE